MNDKAELEAACKDERVLAASQKAMDKVAKDNKFIKYEYCRAHRLFKDPFTVENNLMTPT
jgi:long-chain acyl-CoA synthetase